MEQTNKHGDVLIVTQSLITGGWQGMEAPSCCNAFQVVQNMCDDVRAKEIQSIDVQFVHGQNSPDCGTA